MRLPPAPPLSLIRRSLSPAADILLILLICAAPLALLMQPGQQFGADWTANVWLTSYFGEYFRQHHAFPEVINTAQLTGMPYPVFYGFLLYPLTGLVSSITNPHAALRLVVGAVFVLQTWQVFQLMKQAGGHRWFSLVTAAVACWSTYALTNLYNRGALNELFAVALLTSATCLVCRACLTPAGPVRRACVATGLLCFVLAAGAHPITAVFGGLCFALFVLLFWAPAKDRGALAGWLVGGAIAGAVVLAPWLYAVARFGRHLHIAQHSTSIVIYWPDDVDALATRLMPFPYDRRVVANPGMSPHLSPYLDTQVTIGLGVLAVFLAIRLVLAWRRRMPLNLAGVGIAALAWTLFGSLLLLSVRAKWGENLPGVFRNLQFAYRLVSYLNLALLFAVAGILVALPADAAGKAAGGARTAVLWSTLALAAGGLLIKLQHGQVLRAPAPPVTGALALNEPLGFYGAEAYSIVSGPARFPANPAPPLRLVVRDGADFGMPAPAKIILAEPQTRELQVQPFPWNQVLLNGRPLAAEAATTPRGSTVALAAGENTIEYAWRPDAAWSRLKILSRAVLLGWLALVAFLQIRVMRTVSHPAARPENQPATP